MTTSSTPSSVTAAQQREWILNTSVPYAVWDGCRGSTLKGAVLAKKKKKRKAKATTPGVFRSALRRLWLRSPERAEALKRTGYCCERCGVKQSKAKGHEVKIEVHHPKGVNLDKAWEESQKEMFVPADELEPLCVSCHKQHHHKGEA